MWHENQSFQFHFHIPGHAFSRVSHWSAAGEIFLLNLFLYSVAIIFLSLSADAGDHDFTMHCVVLHSLLKGFRRAHDRVKLIDNQAVAYCLV